MTEPETVWVECYSGHTYAQEPRAVVWAGQRHVVAQVEARWRTPDGPAFRLRTEAGDRFDLHYHESTDTWSLIPGTRYPVPGTRHPAKKESDLE